MMPPVRTVVIQGICYVMDAVPVLMPQLGISSAPPRTTPAPNFGCIWKDGASNLRVRRHYLRKKHNARMTSMQLGQLLQTWHKRWLRGVCDLSKSSVLVMDRGHIVSLENLLQNRDDKVILGYRQNIEDSIPHIFCRRIDDGTSIFVHVKFPATELSRRLVPPQPVPADNAIKDNILIGLWHPLVTRELGRANKMPTELILSFL